MVEEGAIHSAFVAVASPKTYQDTAQNSILIHTLL